MRPGGELLSVAVVKTFQPECENATDSRNNHVNDFERKLRWIFLAGDWALLILSAHYDLLWSALVRSGDCALLRVIGLSNVSRSHEVPCSCFAAPAPANIRAG